MRLLAWITILTGVALVLCGVYSEDKGVMLPLKLSGDRISSTRFATRGYGKCVMAVDWIDARHPDKEPTAEQTLACDGKLGVHVEVFDQRNALVTRADFKPSMTKDTTGRIEIEGDHEELNLAAYQPYSVVVRVTMLSPSAPPSMTPYFRTWPQDSESNAVIPFLWMSAGIFVLFVGCLLLQFSRKPA